MSTETIVIWVAALATLGVYTILYKENPVSRLLEHIFIGLSAGYLIATTWTQNLASKWWVPMVAQRHWYWIFAPIIGLLFYFIYSRRYTWLARLVMGFFFGTSSGLFFREFFPLYWPQVYGSFKPLRPTVATAGAPAVGWSDTILHHWVFVVILLTVMSYFFFSVSHEGKGGRALARSAVLGRWFLMIAFGAMFGNTVMARVSLFIGRVQFLLHDWLGSFIGFFGSRPM